MRPSRRLLSIVLFLLQLSLLPALGAPSESRVVVPVASVFARPSAASERVTQALLGDRVRVLKTQGAWAQVLVVDQYRLAEGYPGWMLGSHLSPARPTGAPHVTIRVARATVRRAASPSASPLRTVYLGTRLPVLTGSSDWTEVGLPGSPETGFVRADEVATGPLALKSGQDVVNTALLLRGTRYLWGGVSAAGIDCSGLTYESFRMFGITLPRDADQQFLVGRPIERDDLQSGDLVFFGRRGGSISHVGIYWKDGRFVEAAGATGVTVSRLSSRGGYRGARRVIGVPLTMPSPSP